MKQIPDEVLDQLLEDCDKPEDILGANRLLANHLGYCKHEAAGQGGGNSCTRRCTASRFTGRQGHSMNGLSMQRPVRSIETRVPTPRQTAREGLCSELAVPAGAEDLGGRIVPAPPRPPPSSMHLRASSVVPSTALSGPPDPSPQPEGIRATLAELPHGSQPPTSPRLNSCPPVFWHHASCGNRSLAPDVGVGLMMGQ